MGLSLRGRLHLKRSLNTFKKQLVEKMHYMQKLMLSHNPRASKIMKNFPELKVADFQYHKELKKQEQQHKKINRKR